MQGTIKRNNVLEPMSPYYGCHHTQAPNKFKSNAVHHSKGWPSFPMRMSMKCRYDRKHQDERCKGCKVEYDAEYVDSLK